MGEFATDKFPDATAADHLLKLKGEAQEAIDAPQDSSEYADCLLCLFGAAYKAGFSLHDLIYAAEEKFNIVQNWQIVFAKIKLTKPQFFHKSYYQKPKP